MGVEMGREAPPEGSERVDLIAELDPCLVLPRARRHLARVAEEAALAVDERGHPARIGEGCAERQVEVQTHAQPRIQEPVDQIELDWPVHDHGRARDDPLGPRVQDAAGNARRDAEVVGVDDEDACLLGSPTMGARRHDFPITRRKYSRNASLSWARAPARAWASSSCARSSCSGTPSFLTPSISAVRPQRSSDSVNTSLARVKVLSSWAICSTVSVRRRLIASWSGPSTVENAAVREMSAIEPPSGMVQSGVQSLVRRLELGLPADDRHDLLVVEENAPLEVHPGLDGAPSDVVPVMLGEDGHEGGIDGLLLRLVEQYLDLAARGPGRHLAPEAHVHVPRGLFQLRVLAQVLGDPQIRLAFPDPLLVEVGLAAVHHLGARGQHVVPRRAFRGLLDRIQVGRAGGAAQSEGDENHERSHARHHISADSSTMPRSITRAALPSIAACSAGTSGDSPSCRSPSMSRRSARIKSPSWPPKDSSTMAAQSLSPDAHRNTAGMNPVEMPTGMDRCRRRCSASMLSAIASISWRACRSLGLFLRNARAT